MLILKKIDGHLQEISEIESGCWINIYPPFDDTALKKLCEELEVPFDFIKDSTDMDERSRVEREDAAELIVINTPVKNEEDAAYEADYITVPIGIVSVGDILLTISPRKNPVIDYFLHKHLKSFDPEDQKDFVLRIFERSVYIFMNYLKKINNARNEYQKELYNSSRNDELLKLMNLQKSLVYFATTLRDNDQLMKKIKRADFIHIRDDEEKSDLMEDIMIDNAQALEMSDVYNNILNSTLDTFASIISNNLNNVMKRLTSITIILMVPTLIASFYGMNVKLPFADNPFAFFISIGIAILLSLLLVLIFRRSRII